jgi:hypothetical protein
VKSEGKLTNDIESHILAFDIGGSHISCCSFRPPDLNAAVERVRQLVLASAAQASRHGYASDFEQFSRWCRDRNLTPLPASPDV